MPFRLRIVAAFAFFVVLSVPAVNAAVKAPTPAKYKHAEKLYQDYCGHCHALKEARAVGFGSAEKLGPGEEAGPSFDPLYVPHKLSFLAVLGTWDGHSKIMTQMTWDEIHDVAYYIEAVTKDHPYIAQMPSDEFLTPTPNPFAAKAAASGSRVTVGSQQIAAIGKVLVNGTGRTLYHHSSETRNVVKCTGACAATWPPLLIGASAKPVAGPGATASLLGKIKRPDGKTQVTYRGKPLYLFSGDKKKGDVKGQGRSGIWYAIAPSGAVVKKAV